MNDIAPGYIRISSILQMIPSMGSDGLWGYPMQKIDQDVLKRKADLGSNVHQAISDHTKNEFYIVSDKEQGYLDSYLKWESSVKLECHKTEQRLYCEPLKLTGCIDMIGKTYGRSAFHIIDFKCTVSQDKLKWPIQAAFYHFLAESNGIHLDRKCLFVQLDPDGEMPKVYEYEITKELTSTAMSLYNIYLHLTAS